MHQFIEGQVGQPVLVNPAGGVDGANQAVGPCRPALQLLVGGAGLVRIEAERLDDIDAVVGVVPPAGQGDPGISRGHHVRGGIKAKDGYACPDNQAGRQSKAGWAR